MALVACILTGCGEGKTVANYPKSKEQQEEERIGKLTGEDGILLMGRSRRADSASIGVNGYLWRAALDTVYALPLISVDPLGGVILTDWYDNSNERFKLNIVILGGELRVDGVKVSAFRQVKKGGTWENEKPHAALAQEIEEKILLRAREVKYLGSM